MKRKMMSKLEGGISFVLGQSPLPFLTRNDAQLTDPNNPVQLDLTGNETSEH